MNKLLIIFIIGVAIFGYAASQGMIPFSIGGFTTLSLQQTSLSSSDPILNGQVWILSVIPGGLGQYASGAAGTFNSNQIATSDGTHATNDLTVGVENVKNICQYPIKTDYAAPKIYKFYTKYYDVPLFTDVNAWLENTVKPDCSKFGDIFVSYGKFPNSFKAACIYGVNQGTIGKLPERPNVQTQVKVSLVSQGQSYVETIDNTGPATAKLGNIAYATSSGAIKTYEECPQALQSSYHAVYDRTAMAWRTADSTKYNNYKAVFITQLSAPSSTYNDANSLESTVNDLNLLADFSLQSKTLATSLGTPAQITGDIDNGIVTITADNAIYLPVLTFYVKTNFLGIVTPSPIPKITSTSDVLFRSGDTGTAIIGIANDGDTGNIDTYLKCNSPIQVITGIQTRTLNKGATDSIAFSLSGGGITTRTSASCTAYAQVRDTIVQQSFIATIDPVQVCIPNKPTCSGDKIKVCNAEGSGDDSLKAVDCAFLGQTCGINNVGQIACVSKTLPPSTTIPPVTTTTMPGVGGISFSDYLPYILLSALGAILLYALFRTPTWAAVGAIIGIIAAAIYQYIASSIFFQFFNALGLGWLGWVLFGGVILIIITFFLALSGNVRRIMGG